jgi:hypothetical protein
MWKYTVNMLVEGLCVVNNYTEALDAMRDPDMSGASVNGTNHPLDSLTCTSADDYGFRLLRIQAQPIKVEPVVKSRHAVRQYWQDVLIFEPHI